ncbi:cytochrome c3 family protein [Imhoffiella purpurea]|uniref:Cytochrome c-type protein n=1 Tax=Imhoffiella purpurea TaxID=1249627 RepID=W9VIJ8_9GAMM|nr:NapC/NirT family cytochrome c [Imhoffiella purpurea]EXJ16816.1 Cytochrome c-type protein TorY [Imhoffiella purpurea]
MKIRIWIFLILGLCVLTPAFVAGSWILTQSALEATAGAEFCSVCHTMKPFAESHAADVHGGANPKGLVAPCANCHLPHTGRTDYLLAKAETGIIDVWGEFLSIFREPDWAAGLERRGDFVYDSGCLICHAGLDRAPDQQPAALYGHRAYFANDGEMQCVTCHMHVGHKDLLDHLSPTPETSKEAKTGTADTPSE